MDANLEKQLVEKYPNLFKDYTKSPMETCICWGCECGNGWYNILDSLFKNMSRYPEVYLVQVKEKFGTLRVYWAGHTNNNECELIDNLVDTAERLSGATCEICGKEGTIERNEGYWIRTLCKECKNKTPS